MPQKTSLEWHSFEIINVEIKTVLIWESNIHKPLEKIFETVEQSPHSGGAK